MNTHEFPFIKKKKEEDTLLIFKRFLFEKEKNEIIFATGKEETLIRKATLSATTSPYLRAVMMLGETNTHYYLSIVQSKVEPLLTKEIAGTLIYVSNEEVNKHRV